MLDSAVIFSLTKFKLVCVKEHSRQRRIDRKGLQWFQTPLAVNLQKENDPLFFIRKCRQMEERQRDKRDGEQKCILYSLILGSCSLPNYCMEHMFLLQLFRCCNLLPSREPRHEKVVQTPPFEQGETERRKGIEACQVRESEKDGNRGRGRRRHVRSLKRVRPKREKIQRTCRWHWLW